MDEKSLKAALHQVSELRFFQETGSTNDDALGWAEQDAPDFSVVVAEYQSSGKGRLQRRWFTPAGAALALSIILRPEPQETAHPMFFTALGALALSDVLKQNYGLANKIKWPNDILLNHKKTAGILVEAVWQGNQPLAVVIGIGVNIAPASVPSGETMLFPATCIETELGREIDRIEMLSGLLDRVKDLRPSTGSIQFIKAWRERLAFVGEAVRIEEPGQAPLCGILDGLSEDGSLYVRSETGKIYKIQGGDIRLRPVEAQSFDRGGSSC